MRRNIKYLIAVATMVVAELLCAPEAWACAACFGASDDPMAKGMNAGIYTLLGVVGVVLAGFLVFMVFLARRASSHSDVMMRRAEEIRAQLLNDGLTANG